MAPVDNILIRILFPGYNFFFHLSLVSMFACRVGRPGSGLV